MKSKYARIVRALAHAILISILLVLTLVPSGIALAVPVITASPTSGNVGSTVVITGSGFTGNVTCNITFASGTGFATVFSTLSTIAGNITYNLTVPAVPSGNYTILANDSSSNATIPFEVLTNVTLGSATANAGALVSITGTGFTTSSTATVKFDSSTVMTIGITSTGSFESAFTVPHSYAGNHVVTVYDGIITKTALISITRFIEVSPVTGMVGSTATVIGSGYLSGAAVRVTFDGNEAALTTSDGNGDFRISIVIPSTSGGAHSIAASDGVNSAGTSFTISQGVNLSTTSGFVGASITVTGSAFVANGTVTLKLDDTQLVQVTSNSNGGFSTSFTIPAVPGGSHTLNTSDSSFSVSSTFTVLTSIKVSPASGQADTKITVSGSGFGAGTSVGVSFDGLNLVTVSADSNGSFSTTITAPTGTAGSHAIGASDGTRTASSAFVMKPSVAVAPARGLMGAQVTVTGSGFAANTTITISAANTTVKTGKTNNTGSFAEKFTIPQLDAGNYTISASDGTNSAGASFNVTASFRIGSSTGNVASGVTVSGTGFKGTVTVKFDDTIVKKAEADNFGAFSAAFNVPSTVHGEHTISVSDASIKLQQSFNVAASFDISPKEGNVGSAITVTGSGFSGAVSVKYDSTEVAAVTAGNDGQFSATFKAPASIHGAHTISAADSTVTLNAAFSMDSTPPQAPVPTEPESGSREGSEPTLVWSPVSDPSGFTYTLQLATNANFTEPLIEKPGLKDARYDIPGEEKLKVGGKQAPYYWRVKAIDLAQNESDWSETNSFYVTLLPIWAPWAIGVAGVALILLFVRLFRHRLHWTY